MFSTKRTQLERTQISALSVGSACPQSATTQGHWEQVGLRQRFQGAFLGLALAPAVASNFPPNASANAQTLIEVERCFQQWASVTEFLAQPPRTDARPTLLATLPILLRSHEQAKTARHYYIYARLGGDAIATAQQWVLSDVIARLLGPMLPAASPAVKSMDDWRGGVKEDMEDATADLPPAYHHHYFGLWNAVLEDDPTHRDLLTSSEKVCHQDVITALSKALSVIDTHPLASRCEGGISAGFQAAAFAEAVGSIGGLTAQQASGLLISSGQPSPTAWQILPVIGLILGMTYGRVGLPALWQSGGLRGYDTLSTTHVVSLADALFAHWSGFLP